MFAIQFLVYTTCWSKITKLSSLLCSFLFLSWSTVEVAVLSLYIYLVHTTEAADNAEFGIWLFSIPIGESQSAILKIHQACV